METFIIIALYICIVFFDLMPKVKDYQRKEKIIYSLTLMVSFVVLVLQTLNYDIPSPSQFIENTVKSLINMK